jgi:hypothetical protein
LQEEFEDSKGVFWYFCKCLTRNQLLLFHVVICLYKSFILFQMLSTRGNKSVIKRVKQEQCRKTNYPHASVNLLLNDPMFLLLCANQIYSLVYDTRQDFFFKNIKYKILHVWPFWICFHNYLVKILEFFWRCGNFWNMKMEKYNLSIYLFCGRWNCGL